MASWFLCLDCGATKTAAAISDANGKVVGRGWGGPSNITYLTVEQFITSISPAIFEAAKAAGLTLDALPPPEPSPFAAAWFGISGADSPSAIAKVAPACSELLRIPIGPHLTIGNDAHLLASPVHLYPVNHVVAVIAGTGSNNISFKLKDGSIEELGRHGGWGWMLGDEGSGFHVGREAIRQLLTEEDKASIRGVPSPHSILRDRLLERFGVGTVMELLGEVYQADGSPTIEAKGLRGLAREKRLTSLPPIVFQTAFEENDWLSISVVTAAALALADDIALLFGHGIDGAKKAIPANDTVLSFGGSLVKNEKYRKLILNRLEEHGLKIPYTHFVEDASVAGATSLAASFKIV